MKIKEITSFLNRIEKCLKDMDLFFENVDDFYYCTNSNQKHCIVIPYVSVLDLELPSYKECLNYVIVSNEKYVGTNADIKYITIQDLELLVDFKNKKSCKYSNIINLFFFNERLIDCLESLDDNSNDIKKQDNKNITNNKDSYEYMIDIASINNYLNCNLIKNKKYYSDNNICVIPIISKLYNGKRYWYGYHDYQIKILLNYQHSYVSFFFKDRSEFLLMPKAALDVWFEKLNSTKKDGKEYWHIYFMFKDEKCLWQIPNNGYKDVSQFLVSRIADVSNTNDDEKIDEIKSNDCDSERVLSQNDDPKVDNSNEIIIKINSNVFHETKTKK